MSEAHPEDTTFGSTLTYELNLLFKEFQQRAQELLDRHEAYLNGSPLSELQQYTLGLYARGLTIREVAEEQGAPMPTVQYRTNKILALYKTHSTTVALTKAYRAGHIRLDDTDTKWEGDEPTYLEVAALQGVADFGTNARAAAEIGVSADAVKARLQSAGERAGATKRTDLIVRALKAGYIQ